MANPGGSPSTRLLTSPHTVPRTPPLPSSARDILLKTFKLALGHGTASLEEAVPLGNRSSCSSRAAKVARGRFVGPASDDWALSARPPAMVFPSPGSLHG